LELGTLKKNPFAEYPRTAEQHFRICYLAAVSHLIRQVVQSLGTYESTFEQYPFLAGYNDELAEFEPNDLADENFLKWWDETINEWESETKTHLPLRAMREACGLDQSAILLLLTIGLIEEDSRFGLLFEAMHGIASQHRPTLGLMNAWWRDVFGYSSVRAKLRMMHDCRLVQYANVDAPRPEWALQVSGILWDALRGEVQENFADWLIYHSPEKLLTTEQLILPEDLQEKLFALPKVLRSSDVNAVIVRGPERNGRKTLLGALAHALGLGVLEVKGLEQKNDDRWQLIGTLATALHAMPIFVFDVAPGETIETPSLKSCVNPIGIALGKQGGIAGQLVENVITLTLKMPDEEARREHWKQSFKHHQTNQLDLIAERFHITGGNIRRAAKLAVSYSALDDKEEITLSDVQQASRALNRQTLDTLAVRIETEGSDWNQLSVSAETMRELYLLESRCRYRERLRDEIGTSFGKHLNSGVRALLCGGSGTGKTLAARLLAASLQMDLYRLDLSTVVNKYIGETEKNLNRIFSRVEELDVILLLDEGDALLTSRTQVSNSNDRYANLETNYLLQRLESFEGILLVTTNAGDRIDGAFQRRMDVVIDFILPSVYERRAIWRLHLPTHHSLSDSLLDEVARRCELTGGQIRNAVLHASAVALDQKTKITASHLEAALLREYRKLGAVCPVRLSSANGHYV
jgi:hypothetical protein